MMERLLVCAFLFILCGTKGVSQDQCRCCTENHGAFDFWVGEWRVTNTDGNLVGTNTIAKIEDGCVLLENWKGTTGTTGTSVNFYNGTSGKWEQLWVDNSGSHLKLSGIRENGKMVLSSEAFLDEEGEKAFHRISWTPNEDGTVRQLWEVVKENEEVSIAFDGLYQRKEK